MLSEIGYATFVIFLNSKDYGVPQERKRLYMGAIALELYKYNLQAAQPSASDMAKVVQSLAIQQPLAMSDVLLEDTSPFLAIELDHWLQLDQNDNDSLTKEASWQKKHQDEFEKHGLRWGHATVPPNIQLSPWFSCLSAREKDIFGL